MINLRSLFLLPSWPVHFKLVMRRDDTSCCAESSLRRVLSVTSGLSYYPDVEILSRRDETQFPEKYERRVSFLWSRIMSFRQGGGGWYEGHPSALQKIEDPCPVIWKRDFVWVILLLTRFEGPSWFMKEHVNRQESLFHYWGEMTRTS